MQDTLINSNTIKKYKNFLTDEECDFLYNYTFSQTNNPVNDPRQVPWEIKGKTNTLYYYCIDNQEVRQLLQKYKYTLAEEMTKQEGVPIYPHLTTMVLWKPGQQMPRHVDNGNGHPGREDLSVRYSTSITYLNDNFKGGHTFIRNDNMDNHLWRSDPTFSFPTEVLNDYISIPEKGTTLTFYASDQNAHGVTKLEEGDRIVLSTWFTKNPEYKEDDDYYISIEDHNRRMQEELNPQKGQQT
jgi:hypothetical protein